MAAWVGTKSEAQGRRSERTRVDGVDRIEGREAGRSQSLCLNFLLISAKQVEQPSWVLPWPFTILHIFSFSFHFFSFLRQGFTVQLELTV